MSRARELGNFAGTINASGDLSFDDNTGILDSNGNEIILFQEAASAVNYLNIGNHSTGNAPYVTAGGTDTDIDLDINPKGAGKVVISGVAKLNNDLQFSSSGRGIIDQWGNYLLRFTQTNNSVNYISIQDQVTGSGPIIKARGSDTNVDLVLEAQGTGVIKPSSTIEITGVTEPIWFSETGNKNGILFDDEKQKRITWNDGAGNFTIRSGSYYNVGEKYVKAGDGAAKITLNSDGGDGSIILGAEQAGTNADDPVTYTTQMMVGYNIFTINGNNIQHDGAEGAWINVSFQNSWANYGAPWANAQYRKAADGRIDIRGLVKLGSPVNGVVFTLPVGYRPSGNVMFATYGGGGIIRLDVAATGTVSFQAGGNASYSSLTCSFYI